MGFFRYYIGHDEKFGYERDGYVLLEEILSPSVLQQLRSHIQHFSQSHRSIIEAQKKEAAWHARLYARDIALLSSDIQKILFSKALGGVASTLSMKKKLRYAGDWLWEKGSVPWSIGSSEPTSLASHFKKRYNQSVIYLRGNLL